MSRPIVYLMRGLPSCGKSHTAKKLAGQSGVVLETDRYFFSEVGDDPTKFQYRSEELPAARQWNYDRFCEAVASGRSPIVVDRGNSLCLESYRYVRFAMDRGYEVRLQEPESPWWQEIRVLLKYKNYTQPVLYKWADQLAAMNRETHRTPAALIRKWIDKWRYDLTVDEILAYGERNGAHPRYEDAAGLSNRCANSKSLGLSTSTPSLA